MTPLLPAFVSAPEPGHVYHCDALTLLRAMPPGSVDAVITDPPYELTELDFDQAVVDWAAWWTEVKRVLARPSSPVVLFSQQPFTTDLICSNRNWWRMEIVVEFTMPVGYLDAKRRPLRCHQNIEVFSERQAFYEPVMEFTNDVRARVISRKKQEAEHYNGHRSDGYVDIGTRYPRDVWRFAQRNTAFANTVSLHPTAKPPLCMERLVQMFSSAGDLVVDPFAGSGTTGVAAIKHGRRFIGCDNGLDQRTGRLWSEIANERLALPYTVPMFAEAF